MIINVMLNASLLQTVWVTPQDPGSVLTVPVTANVAQSQKTHNKHNKKQGIYENFHTMYKAI